MLSGVKVSEDVSTHSRPKAAGEVWKTLSSVNVFQHTAARRRLAKILIPFEENTGFNTQPPEGGWYRRFFYFWEL